MEMKLSSTNGNQFNAYDDNSVSIGEASYTKNIIVTNTSISQFTITDIKQIELKHLAEVLDFEPDLIIFGSGRRINYPDRQLLNQLNERGIGVEVMSIQSLCRTFNFLVSEERRVAGILLFDII